MMPERYRYWIVVVLALCSLSVPIAYGEPSHAQQRELERAEGLLREWLTDLPPNSGVAITRDAQRVTLRFSTNWAFDPDSSALKHDAKTALPLSAALRLMKRRRTLNAQVSVYTDSLGDDSANQSFSAARAKALCAAFAAQGIPATRLHQHGAGSGDPVSSNGTPEGRMENRRVEIAFTRAG